MDDKNAETARTSTNRNNGPAARPVARWAWSLVLVAAVAGAYAVGVIDRLEQAQTHNLRTLEQTARAVEGLVQNAHNTVKSLNEAGYACEFFKRQKRLKLIKPDQCKNLFEIDVASKEWNVAVEQSALQLYGRPKVESDKSVKESEPPDEETNGETKVEPDIKLEFRLDQILYDAPFGDAFDLVMIANTDGRVFEQHRPAASSLFLSPGASRAESPLGLRIDDLDKLKLARETKDSSTGTAKFADSTSVAKVLVAGSSYYLMCQPLRLNVDEDLSSSTSLNSSDNNAEASTWRLCGLISSERSHRQALEVASPLVIAMFAAALLSLLAWPIFKVLMVAQRERLRFIDLYFVLLATAATIMVATALLFSWESSSALRSDSEARLENLSRQIENDLMAEFGQMFAQLLEHDGLLLSEKKHIEAIKQQLKDKRVAEKPLELQATQLFANQDDDSDPANNQINLGRPNKYPYMTSAFWMRPCDGRQLIKATVRDKNTPAVKLDRRAYFNAVKKEDLWKVGDREYFVQTFASITTGEFSAALSTRSDLASSEENALEVWNTNELEELSHDCTGDIYRGFAAAISARPYSVIYPMLAPGVGFAVVDDIGDAVFHSDERRATLENLLDDDGLGERLGAALVSRTNVHFDSDYRTRPHQIYVKRMDQLPWSIVTFADEEILRTMGLEVLGRATVLVVLYLLILTVLTIAYVSLRRREVPRWLWPLCGSSTPDCAGLYNNISLILLSASIVFVLALRWISGDAIVLLSAIIPLSALGFVIVGFSMFDHGKLKAVSVRKLTAWTVGLLMVVVVVWYSASSTVSFDAFEGLLFLGITLLAAVISSRQPRWWTDSLHAYMRTAILLWLIVAILPTYGFFNAAYQSEMPLVATLEQNFYQQAKEHRSKIVREHYRDIEFESDDHRSEFLDQLVGDCGNYDASLFGAFATKHDTSSLDVLWKAASRRQPIYNETTTHARNLESRRLIANGALHQAQDQSRLNTVCGKSDGSSRLVSPPVSVEPGWRTVLLGIPAILLLWAWVVYGAQRLFFGRVDVDDQLVLRLDDLARNDIPGHTLAIVVSPIQYADLTTNSASYRNVDLLKDELPRHLVSSTSAEHIMCVNMISALRNEDRRMIVLAYLEGLLRSDKRCVLIVSQTDVSTTMLDRMFGEDVDARKRLLAILSRFATRHLSLAKAHVGKSPRRRHLWRAPESPWVDQEVDSLHGLREVLGPRFVNSLQRRANRQEVLESIVTAAKGYYKELWDSCSSDEKLVLAQLEQESVVNPKQSDFVRSLLNRGFLKKDHSLRLVNESFGLYVLRAADPARVQRWEKTIGPRWANRRAILLSTVFVILLFLWFTQRDVVETWIAYIGAVAVALSGILRIMSGLRGGSADSA